MISQTAHFPGLALGALELGLAIEPSGGSQRQQAREVTDGAVV